MATSNNITDKHKFAYNDIHESVIVIDKTCLFWSCYGFLCYHCCTRWFYGGIFGNFPSILPDTQTWVYLVVQGLCIPGSWLVQYRLISYIGASNTAIVTTLNTMTTATVGLVFLNEPLSWLFLGGSVVIFAGILLALGLQPDTEHHAKVSMRLKVGLAISGAVLFAIAMFAEKLAINQLGAWSYAGFGWSMQALGATGFFMIFGRSELPYINSQVVKRTAILGVLTSLAGMLYVYALSMGSLSHTVVATSGKVAVVLVLSAIFLRERNALLRRITAFMLVVTGLFIILG